MTNPIIKIVNSTTGEEVERPMNLAELKNYNQDKSEAEAKQQAETEKAEARSAAEAKLIELGLTVDDLKALLG
jgi:hypothetical protein